MTRFAVRGAILACACALTGCFGQGADDGEVSGSLSKYVLAAPPKDLKQKLNIDYDGKVVLLGYAISPASEYEAGTTVKLTLYWKLTGQLDPGWNLFTHVLATSGERLLNIDNVGPLRRWRGGAQTLPPSKWQTGKVYVDEQSFTIPRHAGQDSIQIVTGVWKGETRLKVKAGAHDAENRGIVARLELQSHAKRAASKKKSNTKLTLLQRLSVYKLNPGDKLKIDGVLDEPAWRMAASTRQFVDVKTGERSTDFPVGGRVKLTYDDEAMYLGFNIKDRDIVGGFDQRAKDPYLWTKDAVEIMIDPDGDGDNKDYYEVQIGPQNLVFDSRFDTYDQPKASDAGPFGHQDWSAQLTSAVKITGTLDRKDQDDGYVVEAKIPWKAFDKAKRVPPKSGDTWRMNFYAIENERGVAWSPILGKGNFHKASRFGRVVWIDRNGLADPARTRLGNLDPKAKRGSRFESREPERVLRGLPTRPAPALPPPP